MAMRGWGEEKLAEERLAAQQVQRARARARMQRYVAANSHNYSRVVELRADFDMFRERGDALRRDSDIPSALRTDVSVSYASRDRREIEARAATRRTVTLAERRTGASEGGRAGNVRFRRDFSVPIIMHARADARLP